MSIAETSSKPFDPAVLDAIISETVAPAAEEIDNTGAFPRAALRALGEAGLLGLVSSVEVGGLGQTHRAAARVVERLASTCASTAMVVCMHYAGTAVIEAHGPVGIREAIARGEHVTTLAFSEQGSRSHFWAPTSTATQAEGGVRLDARKSWVTSAGQADSYVWSSRPLAAEGQSSIWLVPAESEGLHIPFQFDGMGLRGNHSSPITAEGVTVPAENMLGADGEGFNVMMGIVLPYFQLMSAGFSVGTMVERFHKLLLEMSYDDPQVRPLLDLEGLKVWREGRVEGYRALDRAVDELRFYDEDGRITINDYRY